MRMLVLILILGLLTSATDAGAARIAPSAFENRAFGSLRSTLNSARGRLGSDPDLRRAFDGGIRSLNYLNRLRREHDVPPEYSASLNELETLLREKLSGDISPEERAEIARETAADLQTKAACASKRLTPGDDPPPFDPVAVDARTIAGGNEISGCQVWFVLRGWARYGKQENFPELSSPSKKNLPPGNYYLWSTKDGKKGERVRVDLGADGQLTQKLDLPVP